MESKPIVNPPVLFDPSLHTLLIPSIVDLHKTCILEPPYTIATFLPPISTPLMTSWWEARVAEVASQERKIFISIGMNPLTKEQEIAGVVTLALPFSQTGPFRGLVEKLLVLPTFRNLGVAKALMGLLELEARKLGRTMLLLDTVTGSPAELVYPRLGYIQYEELPESLPYKGKPGTEIKKLYGKRKPMKLTTDVDFARIVKKYWKQKYEDACQVVADLHKIIIKTFVDKHIRDRIKEVELFSHV
ncbi:hypothetical protein B7494_g5212 [Chlorociboria aeruginascens]|nr:hypothetical protein B7494_g5212 [Chlorociboria aeruginascens]